MTPKLVIISAPSGAGKTTLCDALLQDYPELCYSVSCTTREPRGEEEDGVDYHFLPVERFKSLIDDGAFLEHAVVHGNFYGTLAAPIREALAEGQSVLLDIDVAGAEQVRKHLAALASDDPLRDGLVDIFVSPPSLEELRRRLETRGEDAPETIERRVKNAAGEMARRGEFRYNVVNDDLRVAYKELCAILEHEEAVIGPENGHSHKANGCGHDHGHGSCCCGHSHG